jgi:hypothetical protein
VLVPDAWRDEEAEAGKEELVEEEAEGDDVGRVSGGGGGEQR